MEILRLTNQDITRNRDFKRVRPDGRHLKEIVSSLESTVFGQPQAMEAFGRAILRSTAGMSMPDRPEGSYLFAGPPGVGKTESSRALVKFLHPDEQDPDKFLTVVDCSNLSESHSVSKLVGSPPGYVGSGNPDLLLVHPEFFSEKQTVVVFDEFEKAHPAVWRQMLSVLDRGVLQITAGSRQYGYDTRVINTDWSNTTVIFTTNIGSREMIDAERGKHLGFTGCEQRSADQIRCIGTEAIKSHFKEMPELLDRMDEIIIFDPLTPPSYARILDKFVTQLNDAQRYGQNYLALTAELKDYLVSKTPKDSGGRGLRRFLEKEVITPMAAIKYGLPINVPVIAGYTKEGIVFWAGKKL